ncbi:N-acetyltransferase [Actinoplanes sp. NPDC049548]|uniref:GNAT family N-acetyltransferase n=1 Tax=Actinoplanes sp. NPDC049548 TaxID=3155152 RepID=UPI003449E529
MPRGTGIWDAGRADSHYAGRVSTADALTWIVAPLAVEGELLRLAERCLAADGGLPLSAEPGFVRRRWVGDAVLNVQVRTADGGLVAAGAIRPTDPSRSSPVDPVEVVPADGAAPVVLETARPTDSVGASSISASHGAPSGVWRGGATFAGLVDPEFRSRGLGGRLLDWGLTEAARLGGAVTVETESLTARSRQLFAGRGLRQVFAEDVLRFDLGARGVPEVAWPSGTTVREWSDADAERFFRVYDAAFRERPGFPGWSAAQWIADVVDDDEFRPGWSLLASVPGLGDAGFVTAAVGWIVQVGVVPAARGRGLGAALVTEALRRMRSNGAEEAWLDVNVDNPAAGLYRRLGFEDRGRRARFQLA